MKKFTVVFLIVFLLCIVSCSNRQTNGIVVFQSDFGLKDGAVSAMKGVALNVDSSLQLYDVTHDIPPFSIWDASYRLYQTYKYWPEKTVFVSVVDPGVGSERLSLVSKLKNGSFIVTPDNGTLTLLANDIEETRIIDESKNRLPGSGESATFHGRDIYAYVAARLANGTLKFKNVGKILRQEPVLLEYGKASLTDNGLMGIIEMHDVQFGNIWTNIGEDLVKKYNMEFGKKYNVVIKYDGAMVYSSKVAFLNTFSDISIGESLIYMNSMGNLSLAINSGSFANTYGISYGEKWTIEILAL